MSKFFQVPVFIFCLLLAPCSLLLAQPIDEELPQITGCIALINAKVITAPGKSPVVSTVVMKNGLITQIGKDIKIPPDAYTVAADSFYVYAAFIDAFSYTGIKDSESESGGGGGNQQGPGNRGGSKPTFDAEGNLPLEEAGITPYKSVRATFDPKEKSIADWRAQGFAVAHIVPRGKMLPGKGSIMVLSGKETDQVLWKEDISMYGQWTGAGGGYPSTVIGVMAKWRELYHNATQAVAHQAAYEKGTLVSRPTYNQAHEALMPIVKKEMPVYFRAPKVKDISRAMELQEDLGMKMVIANAEEAWYLKDKFKSENIPLILSLWLPEDKSEAEAKAKEGNKSEAKAEAEAKEGNKTEAKAEAQDSLEQTIDTIASDPEKAAFEKKRAESLKAYREQAGVFAKEEIPFSFGTMRLKTSEFSKNISLMIENGLSADTALMALTTQPASLLGIEKYCGTVEIGKMANLIVSTKPLFEKEAAIKYMIVEGGLYAYEIKEKKKPSGKPSDPVTAGLLEGKWEFEVDIPDQREKGEFDFKDSDGILTGTIHGHNITGNTALEDIVLEGNDVSFTFDMEAGGQMIELEFDLKLDGETFEGTVNIGVTGMGTFPISGKRISKPN